MLTESEQNKTRLQKELDDSSKQIKDLMAENSNQKKNLSQIKEKTSKDEIAKSELRKEIFELKQTISALMSEKEQLKSDLSSEQRR